MTSLPLYGVGFVLIGRHVRVCSHVSGCRVRGSFVCLSIVSSEVGLTKCGFMLVIVLLAFAFVHCKHEESSGALGCLHHWCSAFLRKQESRVVDDYKDSE